MATLDSTSGNSRKAKHLTTILTEVLAEVLQRDFFGTASIEISIQDGTIQNIRRRVERIER